MEHILLPSQITFNETDNKNVSEVVITPCHQGYGTTIGNALRRVLLSSIPGAAVEAVKIDGVQHEFSAVEGVQEDVIEIMMNLKQVAVKLHSDQPVRLNLTKKGKGPITVGDFEKNADVEVFNPDQVIATLNTDKTFEMEVIIGNGLGYITSKQKDSSSLDLGTILTDSFYSPVKDVGYKVDNTRVGDITDYEKITFTVETNGTVTPQEAFKQSTEILINHMNLILDASTSGASAPVVEAVEEEPAQEAATEETE